MRKILLVLVCFIFTSFIFTTPASAEFKKTLNSHGIFISSNYKYTIAEKYGHKYVVQFILERHMLQGNLVANKPDFSISIKALAVSNTSPVKYFEPDNNFDPLVVFSFQTQPKIVIANPIPKTTGLFSTVNKNSETDTNSEYDMIPVIINRRAGIGTYDITLGIKSDMREPLSTAKNIIIILPLNNGTHEYIKLPEEIVKEWNDVCSIENLWKERKQMLKK